MNFLSPWFLAGALLIGGPILAHLIRRATRERVSFTAMRFLDPSAPRLDRRSRIQHPWLLLLRCLIVAFLAAGFARPFLRAPAIISAGEAVPQSVVVVLDESASMQRTGLWTQATERVEAVAAKLGALDQLAVFAASGRVEEVMSWDTWSRTAPGDRVARLRSALATRRPTGGPTYLDAGIEAAADLLAEKDESAGRASAKRVVVVSDFAAGARVAGLAGKEWPRGCELVLETVEATPVANLSLQWLGWSSESRDGLVARLRISRSQAAIVIGAKLNVKDAATGRELRPALEVDLAPSDAQVVSVPLPAGAAAAGGVRFELEGDREVFDNTVWALPPQIRTASIAYFGAHEANDSREARFYLERAAEGMRDPAVKVMAFRSEGEAPTAAMDEARLFVVAETLPPPLVEAIRRRVDAGAFALVLAGEPALIATASALAGEKDWLPGTVGRKDALLTRIDFSHPAFAAFADPRFSDFTKIRFWEPQPVVLPADSKATVVARFEDGLPAVVEAPVGKGRVIVWGGSWAPQSSQWLLSSKFIPWLQSLVERASGGAARATWAEVGSTQAVLPEGAVEWKPIGPEGAAWSKSEPDAAGLYDLRAESGLSRVALLTPNSETSTEVLPLEIWEQLGVPFKAERLPGDAAAAERRRQHQAAAELEAEQKLWRWLLAAAAVFLAFESWMSLRLARRPATTVQKEAVA
jgi:hypothetical protein